MGDFDLAFESIPGLSKPTCLTKGSIPMSKQVPILPVAWLIARYHRIQLNGLFRVPMVANDNSPVTPVLFKTWRITSITQVVKYLKRGFVGMFQSTIDQPRTHFWGLCFWNIGKVLRMSMLLAAS